MFRWIYSFKVKLGVSLCLLFYVFTILYQLQSRHRQLNHKENTQWPLINEQDMLWMAKHLAGSLTSEVVEWKRYKPDKRILYSELFEESKTVKHVRLLVLVLSTFEGINRRNSIRKTWWKECKVDNQTKTDCFFFTDTVNATSNNKEIFNQIQNETSYNNDLITMPTTKGLLFGYRMLYMMQWAWAHFDFDYVMRVDDDVMLCVDHLLENLNSMPKKGLNWGWLHCERPGLIYMDEGVIMFSVDVIQEFLSQDPLRMHCHPYGDQTLAIWIQEIGLNPYDLYHPDQERIHQHPPASRVVEFRWLDGICDMYIALHGVYGNDMIEFWKRKGTGAHYNEFKRKDVRNVCPHEPFMYWDAFVEPFFYEPKHCIERFIWSNVKNNFFGRENNTAQQDQVMLNFVN